MKETNTEGAHPWLHRISERSVHNAQCLEYLQAASTYREKTRNNASSGYFLSSGLRTICCVVHEPFHDNKDDHVSEEKKQEKDLRQEFQENSDGVFEMTGNHHKINIKEELFFHLR